MKAMKKKGRGRREEGFALVTAVSICLLVSILSAAIYTVAGYQMQAARKTREHLKAKVIAEAGANARYNAVKYRFGGFGEDPETEFGGGAYQTTLTAAGSDRALLVSVGRCGLAEARIALSLRNFPLLLDPDNPDSSLPEMLKYAIATEGNLKLHGTSTTVDGDILCGGTCKLSGKPAITGRTVEHSPATIASWFDVSAYTMHPDTIVWDGKTDLSSYPSSAIVYCPGNLTLSGNNAVINCCLIVQGDIDVSSHVVFNKPAYGPTLVSITGDIDLHGGPSISGAVIAIDGTISKMSGGGGTSCNIAGSVVVKGDLDFGGGFSVNYDPGLAHFEPPDTVETKDRTVIIAWQ